jgi:hypothetical protein
VALSVTPLSSPIGTRLVEETAANATAKNNVTGTSGNLYLIDVDNAANAGQIVYLKLWDNASPTVGTTAADWVFKIAAGARRVVAITQGLAFSALSFAVVTSADQAGVTSPGAGVVVRLVTS